MGTLFTITGSNYIKNFIFNEMNTRVFYVKNDGKLYCHDLSSGKAWCNDTALGPPTGLNAIIAGPSQLTWQDSTHHLVSDYNGCI